MSQFCPYTYKGHPSGLEYPWTFPMPSEKERDRRWDAICRSMRKHNFDCLIVGEPLGYMNFTFTKYLYYISNYVPYGNTGTYIVFPLEGEPQLGVENSYGPQFLHCASETSWINKLLGSLYPVRDIVTKVKQLKLQNGRIGVVGYRRDIFTAPFYNALRESFPVATLGDATDAMREAMDEVSRTSEEELTFLRRACEILDLSYEAVAEALKPGVKEYELWAAAEHAMLNNGGWYGPAIYATSGPNPTFPRAPASHYALAMGDVGIFEINSNYGGVSPQICYALSLGQPNREVKEMFEFCKKLYQHSLAELEKKKTFMDIEVGLANLIHDAGYEPMTPQIHRYNMSGAMPMSSPPQGGDYFIVHPNVCNKEYTSGAKLGDTVRITKDGRVERLHRTPVKLNII